MKPSTEHLIGTIDGYDERRGVLRVSVPYSDWPTMIKRGYTKCLVQLKDERPLSHKQRNACYALLKSISDWSGMSKDDTKEYFKLKFMAEDIAETGEKIFSLSDASMSLICQFQRFIIDFIISNDVPCDFDILQFVDDIPSYMYACLVHKKCAICGKSNADMHHSTHKIGIGRDRNVVAQLGMDVQSLCRVHHDEAHTLGQKSFDEKYHLCSVPLEKSIAAIHGIKIGKETNSIT